MRIIKIKFVETPIDTDPQCRGSYCSDSNTILIKQGLPKLLILEIIIHELGHAFICKLPLSYKIKHYIHLTWEILSVVFFDDIPKVKENIEWYLDYYKRNKYVV